MNYQIIIKTPFSAIDDIKARQIVKLASSVILSELEKDENLSQQLQKSEIKFQEVLKDKPPRGIII